MSAFSPRMRPARTALLGSLSILLTFQHLQISLHDHKRGWGWWWLLHWQLHRSSWLLRLPGWLLLLLPVWLLLLLLPGLLLLLLLQGLSPSPSSDQNVVLSCKQLLGGTFPWETQNGYYNIYFRKKLGQPAVRDLCTHEAPLENFDVSATIKTP